MNEIRALCPACGSITQSGRIEPKYYYNPDKGVGICFHCDFRGPLGDEELSSLNVVELKERKAFNPKVFDELEPLPPEAQRYLAKRFPGVSQSQLEAFSLRYSKHLHAIAIPSFKPDGSLQGIKYRLIAPTNDQRFSAETGSEFGGYWIEGKGDKLLIVEGELDAITAKVCGFQGSILALQTNKLSADSISRVRSFKYVFLNLDNDEAGAQGTALIQSISPYQVVSFDNAKDLNELLQKEGLDESNRLLQIQTRTELEKSTVSLRSSLTELVEFLSDRRNTKGDSTGFTSIDKLLGGGLRPQEMTVINAFAKTGKTSFINNICHNLSSIGKKVAIASFEMDPARTLYPSLLSIAGQTNIRAIQDKETLDQSVRLIAEDCSYLNNLITLRRFGYTSWSEVEEWATLMKDQNQIEYLVLDHAGFMVEKMTDADQNQDLAKSIKKLTNTLGLHILVIVQAPKTKDGLSIQTSYGGLAWGMNADNFIILERSKDDDLQLNVRLEAARYPGANPSSSPVHLFYDRETCSLCE